ncbi:short chain dehydrogenase/reductase [Xylariomycetidae sp. FL2044]|nr:short chain dehydrogenase/reductase [Xylariomycetidae sp. FL2044]
MAYNLSFSSTTVIYTAGLIAILRSIIQIFQSASIYLRPSRFSRYAHTGPNEEAPWALVTGATSGIGLQLAPELAKHGFNVVVHGRSPEKLARVISNLQQTFPQRSFRTLVADANRVACMSCLDARAHGDNGKEHDTALDFEEIEKQLRDLHLTVVINNAGGELSRPTFQSLRDSSVTRVTSTISLNALFPLHLGRVLLPRLIQNAPALLVNVSSMADAGFPLIAAYSASKQMLMMLTRGLRHELALEGRADDVEILGVRVARTTAVSHEASPPSFFTPSAQVMAGAILAKAGHGHKLVVAYWTHALQEFILDSLPEWLMDRVVVGIVGKEREREIENAKKRP